MYKNQKLSKIDEEFFDLTKSFDLEDWRTLRNDNYWWTEDIPGLKRPRFTYEKLDLIRHYVNKGFAK